jgi:hypothetical protein
VRECASDVVLIAEDSQLIRRAIQHVVELVFPSSSRPCASFEEAIRTLDEVERPPGAVLITSGRHARNRIDPRAVRTARAGRRGLGEVMPQNAANLPSEFRVFMTARKEEGRP